MGLKLNFNDRTDFASNHDNGIIILQVYGGLALPLIFAALFSIVVIAWNKYRVNYTFIFELDVCRLAF
jgi:hypothetical protein